MASSDVHRDWRTASPASEFDQHADYFAGAGTHAPIAAAAADKPIWQLERGHEIADRRDWMEAAQAWAKAVREHFQRGVILPFRGAAPREQHSAEAATGSGQSVVPRQAARTAPLSRREQVDMIRLLRQEDRHPQNMRRGDRAQLQQYRRRVQAARGRKPVRAQRPVPVASGAGRVPDQHPIEAIVRALPRLAGLRRGGMAHPGAGHHHGPGKPSHTPGRRPAKGRPRAIAPSRARDLAAANVPGTSPPARDDRDQQQPALEKYAAELLAVVDEIRALLKQAAGGAPAPQPRPSMPPAGTVAMPFGATPNSLAIAAQRKAAIGSSV